MPIAPILAAQMKEGAEQKPTAQTPNVEKPVRSIIPPLAPSPMELREKYPAPKTFPGEKSKEPVVQTRAQIKDFLSTPELDTDTREHLNDLLVSTSMAELFRNNDAMRYWRALVLLKRDEWITHSQLRAHVSGEYKDSDPRTELIYLYRDAGVCEIKFSGGKEQLRIKFRFIQSPPSEMVFLDQCTGVNDDPVPIVSEEEFLKSCYLSSKTSGNECCYYLDTEFRGSFYPRRAGFKWLMNFPKHFRREFKASKNVFDSMLEAKKDFYKELIKIISNYRYSQVVPQSCTLGTNHNQHHKVGPNVVP